MDSILQQITEDKVWEEFLAHRLMKGRFTWRTFEEADTFVEKHLYLQLAQKIASGESLGIPIRKEVNKMGSGKKRTVFCYNQDTMRILKLISHLLYRYDDVFAPNCYAFRRGIRAGDAILRLNKALHGRKMWAYKVDIHDYFNSISVPILLPILADILADDPRLYAFFRDLLDDDRAYSSDTLIHCKRGVMAGLPTASFLADVYLKEVDWHFYKAGVIYARYSDDIIIFAPDKETLERNRQTLLSFFDKYHLEVNPSKEKVYQPGEPYEFLGFSCRGRDIDISRATMDKLKGKIRRKARSLRRWYSKEGKDPEIAVRALIRCFNRKLLEMDGDDTLCWASWFFPIITRTEGLREIDRYLQDNCRFVATGRHNKANYRVRYSTLKRLGYRSLVHEYFGYC